LPQSHCRPALENLESRLAPASVSQQGTVLTINLDSSTANENLAIVANAHGTYGVTDTNGTISIQGSAANFTPVSTTTGTITGNGLLEIDILDALNTGGGDSVTFNGSAGNAYGQLFKIDLSHDTNQSAVTLNGASTFAAGLTAVVATGGITASSGSSLTVTGNFGLSAAGAVALANLAIHVNGRSETTSLTDVGAGPGDDITVDNPANVFAGSVNLAVNAASNITLFNSSPLTIGNIVLGSGTLNVTAQGNIQENVSATGGIDTGAGSSAVFEVDSSSGATVDLSEAPNNFAGAVTVNQSNGSVANVLLRNTSPQAALPGIAALTSLAGLTLHFDDNGFSVPSLSLHDLQVTAGGPITETPSAALSVTGNASFAVVGDYGINLPSNGNDFAGTVSFNNPGGDATAASAVNFSNSGNVTLGDSSLGLGTFSVTAPGDIAESGAIVQKPGAGALTFNVAGAGTTVDLSAANDFEGPVTINGSSVTTVSFTNTSALAAFALPSGGTNLALPTGVTDFTLNFPNAPVALPTLSLSGALTVTAEGIVQAQADSAATLTVQGLATFMAGDFPIDLSDDNDFSTISVNNSGPNDVTIRDTNAIDFSSAHVGSGSLSVLASGAITNNGGGIVQTPNAGLARFSAGNNPIDLSKSSNRFGGPVAVSATQAVIANSGTLMLGSCAVTGAFTATSASGGILQAPGTQLTLNGNSSFTAPGDVTLSNPSNQVAGGVALTSVGGEVTFANARAVTLDTSTAGGDFTITAGGAIAQTPTGTITDTTGTASFNAGANAITLANSGNQLNIVALTSTAAGTVQLQNSGALTLAQVQLGSGALTVTAGGSIVESAGGIITQTGPGLLTFSTPANAAVTLGDDNNILGTIALNTQDLTIANLGSLSFAASNITGNVDLVSGGMINLPATALAVNSLTVSANQTVVPANITTSVGGISFTGAVSLAAGVTLDTSSGGGSLLFNGDVNPQGPLTLALADSASIFFSGGRWAQGSEPLTITGNSTSFDVAGSPDQPAALDMGGAAGTLNMGAGGNIFFFNNSTLQVGDNANAAETVTVNTGGGNVTFGSGSRLLIGLGTGAPNTNDELKLAGGGNFEIDPGARLVGSGLAGAGATLLDAGTGQILDDLGNPGGRFAMSVDAAGNPHAFLIGTDIVTASYTLSTLAVTPVAAAANGTVSGFQSTSDQFTVTSSGGPGSELVAATDINGRLDIVVRNAPARETLTIRSIMNGGAGLTNIGGIAIDGPASGSVFINAPTANVFGDIIVAGALSRLTVRDMNGSGISGGAYLIANGNLSNGGGPQRTRITGRIFDSVHVDTNTILSSLTLAQFSQLLPGDSQSSLLAEQFGIMRITGLPAAGVAGDFDANLVNRNALRSTTTPAVSLAVIAGTLSGTWDVQGAVGSVTAGSTTNWNLGTALAGSGAANFVNVGKLTRVANLNLGRAADLTIEASSLVTRVTAVSVAGATLTAGAFGVLQTTGNAALGDVGDFDNVRLTATGGLGALTVAGNASSDNITIQNGNAGTITVGATMSNSSIVTAAGTTGGALGSITVGSWLADVIDANSVGNLRAIGQATAHLAGDFSGGGVTLYGAAGSPITLANFSATGNVADVTFNIDNGGIGTFSVGQELSNGTLTLAGVSGALNAIQAGEWQSFNVTAQAIGTLAVTGTAQGPSGPVFSGDMVNSDIYVFGGVPLGDFANLVSIRSFFVAGDLDLTSNNSVIAADAIGAFSVGRQILGDNVNVSSTSESLLRAFSFGTLRAGQWSNVDLEASTVNAATITGYVVPEGDTKNLVAGDLTGSTWNLQSSQDTAIGALSIAGGINNSSVLDVPGGIGAMSVQGQVADATIMALDPLGLASSQIGTMTIGAAQGMELLTGAIGTLTTTGDLDNSTIAVSQNSSAGPTTPIRNLSVAGGMSDTVLNVAASVTTMTVTQAVVNSQIAIAFAAGAAVRTLSVGQFIGSDLTSQSVGTWRITGSAALGLSGDMSGSLVTLLGSGTALNRFTAAGTISGTAFDIFDGSINSFITGRFLNSQLLVGVQFPQQGELAAPVLSPAPVWNATNQTIGLFMTTAALFDPTDPTDSAAFQDSVVVAAILRTVTLAGVDGNTPEGSTAASFGVGFRAGNGGGTGTVSANLSGITQVLGAPFTAGEFFYGGLAG